MPTNSDINYKNTLNLPRTLFPMKANLPVREKEILESWESNDIYSKLRDERKKSQDKFYLHDGPPFANGNIHLGHVLNKSLKDIVIRYQTMQMKDAPYVPGWDCHGLPIEHQVVKKLKADDRSPDRIRLESRKYAEKFIDLQRSQFKRLGVWGDWDEPYITMNSCYEADILRTFAQLVDQGRVYQGLRPVYWSTGCQTALAEAEVEYVDRTDASIFVRFGIADCEWLNELKEAHSELKSLDLSFIVWTTTPWTLPANLGIAIHPELDYELVTSESEAFILLKSKVPIIEKHLGISFRSVSTIKGSSLIKAVYQHPFLSRQGMVYEAEFVTDDTGSGIVHIAPGHGHDDYHLGQKHNLGVLSPVDQYGRFTEDCGVEEWVGLNVFEANSMVIKKLQESGHLIIEEPILHSYPHCWRSKTPIVFRAVKQWFIKVDDFRQTSLNAIKKVNWHPDWGKNRIEGSVATRQDWCISRQRTWGVPIPVFYDKNNQPILDSKIIQKFADRVEKEGTDLWFTESANQLASSLGLEGEFEKGLDTLDVWIDSGCSFNAVVKKRLKSPADLYLEGSDQHRGWFQSSLLLSCATNERAPFKNVLTHGFVVDGDGKKMSKSVGNVISPEDIMKRLGADILRLWVVSSDYSGDIRVSKDIFDRVSDTYRKFRNTLRYMLGNLDGFDPSLHLIEKNQMLDIDLWALGKLENLKREAAKYFDNYEYHKFYQAFYNFCIKEMSSLYFDILKDRLYTDGRLSQSGKSARTALFVIFKDLTRILSPIMPFTAEEAWSHCPAFEGKRESVHMEAWPVPVEGISDELIQAWDILLSERPLILKQLEEAREKKEIGNSLEAEVELTVFSPDEFDFLFKNQKNLQMICLVSKLEVLKSDQEKEKRRVVIKKSSGNKCARCWVYSEDVSRDPQYPGACSKCVDVLKGL